MTTGLVVAAIAGFLALLGLLAGLEASRRGRRREVALRRELEERALRITEHSERTAAREAVLAAMPDGVVLFEPEGRVAYANPAARELMGRHVGSFSEVSPRPLRQALVAASTGTAPSEIEFETGGRILQATAAAAGEGFVVLVIRDGTEARRLDHIRRDFVVNASHELKTPVASIQALAETLAGALGRDPDAARRFVERLEQEAVRLSRLVTDLLDLSRLEGKPGERTTVPLDEVVAEEAERLRPRAEAAGLRLVLETFDRAPVEGSRGDLGLLVHNLLDNAIRYSPDGGEIRLILRARDGTAELRVADTGIGIASRDLDRIFERFYRVDPARSRTTGGTGLGLSIVRHVAESHGGGVTVRSVLGAGSTFIVRLPVAPA